MSLLCVLGRHRWATVNNPGEELYQWCQRCRRYRANARQPGSTRATDRGSIAGGGIFSGSGGIDGGGHG